MSSALDLLHDRRPFTKDELHRKSTVDALYRAPVECNASQTLYNIHRIAQQCTHRNIKHGEIAAALDYHGIEDIHESEQSQAFRNELHRRDDDAEPDTGRVVTDEEETDMNPETWV
ncbi:hypothetical protein [Salarchaeum sp. JOR-1]|uniref:hypothetical protein n=1 Tax=Salarchaeum sp. JOR-1 TaxID=2599399 RepID=UPI001198804A|nr:hypothetical protein [Salarchaeum sp. JOR-1]QDX40849.1 hypothetical protein FQU85_08020 [Salarchaeum sp. JOR-1]